MWNYLSKMYIVVYAKSTLKLKKVIAGELSGFT